MPPANRTRKPAGPAPTGDDMFVYTAPAGGTITLPPMGKALNAKEMRRLRNSSQLGILFYIVERDNPAGEDGSNPAMDAVDEVLETMTIDEDVPDLIKQWQDFSRTSMGESSAS